MARKGRTVGRILRGLGTSTLLGTAYPGCEDSTEDKLRAARLAESCSLDSECKRTDPKLVCKFGHCHQECNGDEDCKQYQGRCVQPGICQLASEISCKGDASKCRENGRTQSCAEDGECRDTCTVKDDCISGLECSVSGYCAREQELDDGGKLPQIAGTSSASGAAGEGAMSGMELGNGGAGASTEAAGGSGGSPAWAAIGENGGEDTAAGGALPNAGASGGSEVDGGTAGSIAEGGSPGVSEEEPNDDSAQPTVIPLETPIRARVEGVDDDDYFEISVPEGNPAGGYFEFDVVEVGDCLIQASVWPKDHSGAILQVLSPMRGSYLYGYFAAAPGQKYLIEVRRQSGTGFPCDYQLAVRYVPVADPFEPNDTQATATSVRLDEAVEAFLFAGYTSRAIARAEYDDWYKVELAEGPVSVKLSNIPDSTSTQLFLHGSSGQLIQNPELAGTLENELSYEVPQAGSYYIQVSHYSGQAPVAQGDRSKGGLPSHFTAPYTLRVTQPQP